MGMVGGGKGRVRVAEPVDGDTAAEAQRECGSDEPGRRKRGRPRWRGLRAMQIGMQVADEDGIDQPSRSPEGVDAAAAASTRAIASAGVSTRAIAIAAAAAASTRAIAIGRKMAA